MRKKLLVFIALVLAFANTGVIIAKQTVSATPNITICHRDNNAKQPYGPSSITVDASSIINHGHEDHDGPIASSEEVADYLKHHGGWGDIIPSFPYGDGDVFPGLNIDNPWGLAMLANNCQFVNLPVTPMAIDFTDATCVKNEGSYKIPDIKGVTYYVNGHEKKPDTYKVKTNTTIEVTAKADDGYKLNPEPTEPWTHNFVMKTKADCTVTPIKVTFTKIPCEGTGSYMVTAVEGVKYYNGETLLVAGKAYPVSEDLDVTITAKIVTGYFLAEGAQTVWEWSFTVPSAESCLLGLTDITPAPVTFVAPTCSALGSYTIPTTEGINYIINEKVVAAGTYPVANGSTINVTAVPSATKNTIKIGATKSWDYTFTAPANCGSVLGATTVKSLPNTSGTGMNPIAYLAAFAITFIAMAGAAMKRFYTERL